MPEHKASGEGNVGGRVDNGRNNQILDKDKLKNGDAATSTFGSCFLFPRPADFCLIVPSSDQLKRWASGHWKNDPWTAVHPTSKEGSSSKEGAKK